jgi:hypothetical protein
MLMLVQVVAAVLLILGSGLIFYSLLRLDRAADATRRPLREARVRRVAVDRDLPRAA